MTHVGRMGIGLGLVLSLALGCGDDDSTGGGGSGGTPSVCGPVCDNEVECNETPRTLCDTACDAALLAAGMISTSCSDAVNAVLSCAGALSCTEYEAWQNEQPPDGFPCRDETETCDAQCNDLCDQEFDF